MKVLKLTGKQNISHIFIEKGILKQIAEFCRMKSADEKGPSRICVITDSNVAGLYLDYLEKKLAGLDLPVFHHIIPAGEEYKNMETVSRIYDTLAEYQCGRDDMIIALGGGVTGDIAGFAAATFLRGVRHLVQIPTTLLAQVDSSIGGKTGVDLPQGKNLMGAFRQPDLVLIDTQVLDTLPERVIKAGMAEVIKYGCIWDPEILDMVSGGSVNNRLEELIERCVGIKIKVVEEDETEEGLRRILNFGHTIGHGIEKLGNYKELSHGEAVSIGMVAAAKMGESMGITRAGCYSRLKVILQSFALPTETAYKMEDVYEAALSDKKMQGGSIHFVLIEEFGKALVKKIPAAELKQLMKALGD
ncbi:MAG TPA: 3-dehydroquinate synthase [Anaerovoracaceae bacterium]|nr:3-dehydroquinate synthase [Anaerovoracaceae bacterium]